MKKKYILINFIWFGIAALSLIIYLITTKFGSNDEVVKYLSFGLTVTSLFVGLIAIFQSYFSSSNLNKTIGLIDKSNKSVSKSTVSLNELMSSFEKKFALSNELSENNALRLERLIEHLKNEFDKIPSSISELEKKIDSKTFAIPQSVGDASVKQSKELPETYYQEYFNSSSMAAIPLLYAISLAYNSKKNLIISQIPRADSEDLGFYAGFFVASSSAQIFKQTYKEDEKVDLVDMPFLITEINPHYEKYINQRIEYVLTKKKKETWYNTFVKYRSEVEEMFK